MTLRLTQCGDSLQWFPFFISLFIIALFVNFLSAMEVTHRAFIFAIDVSVLRP